jgi:glycosyltransferase involved in cell wall biosynthesis
MYKNTRRPFLKFLTYLKYRLGKQEEIAVCRKFNALVATTVKDQQLFHQELPEQEIFVINNGVQSSFLEPQNIMPEPYSLVFTGLMTHYPNEHGILFFLDEVFPIVLERNPLSRLYIVGAKPSGTIKARASSNVIVTGFVDDVRPYMAKGEQYIIPLFIGGGIRGKALEAMAMKKPIVTTTIGCEGINLKHEFSALFADTPEDLASAIYRLQNDPQLRCSLAESAYKTVLEEYDWNNKGAELSAAYYRVLGKLEARALSPNIAKDN